MHRGPVGTMSGASPTPVAGMRTDPSGETALAARALAPAFEAINGHYRAGLHCVSRTLKRRR